MIAEKRERFVLWFWNQVIVVVKFAYYVLFDQIPRYLGYQMVTNRGVDESDGNNEHTIPRNNGVDEPKNHPRASAEKYPSRKKGNFQQVAFDEKIENSIGNVGNICKLKNPYCVVICNINFENEIVPRNGGEADVDNIEYLLKKRAGFKTVETHFDCKRLKILDIIENIAKDEKTKDHDGLLCFITSHGTSEGIRSVDRKNGTVTVDELTTRLNGKQCKSLLGKPKLFFIQACRGPNTDSGVPHRGSIATDTAYRKDEMMVVPKLPTEADFLICYATTKGNIAYRRYSTNRNEKDMGSWFISVVTDVFSEYMHNEDVMQMMIRVNARVAGMATGDDHVDGKKEMPCQMHRLRSRVMLGSSNAAPH